MIGVSAFASSLRMIRVRVELLFHTLTEVSSATGYYPYVVSPVVVVVATSSWLLPKDQVSVLSIEYYVLLLLNFYSYPRYTLTELLSLRYTLELYVTTA